MKENNDLDALLATGLSLGIMAIGALLIRGISHEENTISDRSKRQLN